MSEFIVAPVAWQDLEHIWDYYALECGALDAADRVRDELFDAMRKLAVTPGLGHFRSDLSSVPVRFWRVREYLIVYNSEKRPIEIARILHGKRDVQAILDTNTPH